MKFIKTKILLPNADALNGEPATYYLIKIEGYGYHLAMFLENEEGEIGWYTNYTSKIFRNVISWCKIDNK